MRMVRCSVILAAMFAGAVVLPALIAQAHHGWAWTTGKSMEIAGVIKTSKLGNPHGVLTMDVKGETWTVEVGQPWRNKDAGLQDSDMAVGKEIRLIGEPASNAKRVIKALRVFVGERMHNLYPDRK